MYVGSVAIYNTIEILLWSYKLFLQLHNTLLIFLTPSGSVTTKYYSHPTNNKVFIVSHMLSMECTSVLLTLDFAEFASHTITLLSVFFVGKYSLSAHTKNALLSYYVLLCIK